MNEHILNESSVFKQIKDSSNLHYDEQPSPLFLLLSSHSSYKLANIPLPHKLSH